MDLNKLPGALPDEKLIGVYRRHPITLLGLLIALILVFIIPPSLYVYLYFAGEIAAMPSQILTLIVLGGGVFILFAMLFIYQQFLDYWLDVWLLTNRRIINIEQKGLFSRTTSELHLYRIQDVTAEVTGFTRSVLDYGMVYIQTAGEQERFIFEEVPHPNEISKNILALAEKDRKEHLEAAMEAAEQTMVDKTEVQDRAMRRLEP